MNKTQARRLKGKTLAQLSRAQRYRRIMRVNLETMDAPALTVLAAHYRADVHEAATLDEARNAILEAAHPVNELLSTFEEITEVLS